MSVIIKLRISAYKTTILQVDRHPKHSSVLMNQKISINQINFHYNEELCIFFICFYLKRTFDTEYTYGRTVVLKNGAVMK